MPEPPTRGGTRSSKQDDLFDRALMALVTRIPGRFIIVLCLVLYPGIGLLFPLAIGWSTESLIGANVFGVTFAAVVGLGWFVVQLEARDRRHLVEWTTDLRHLDAEEFEWFVGEIFRREGWNVRETGHQDRADGNIDLAMTKGADRRLVQCKHWTSWQVGIDEIRAFAGTVSAEKLPTTQGVFVTFSSFTGAALGEAKRTGMTLIDRAELYARVEKVRRPEPCPFCHFPMLLDRSQHGWWFRCTTRGCTGKRDLDHEPARALDLLTQRPWSRSAAPVTSGAVAASNDGGV